jgi:nucleoid-associated protein EbfC
MQQLLAAAAAMQSQLISAQEELAEAEVEGTAGGGLVKATVNGQGELVDLTISPAAVDASDPEETAQTLADLVLAAYRDACRAADELQEQTMAPLTAGFGAAGLGGAGLGGAGLAGAAGLPGLPDLSAFPGFAGLPGPQDTAEDDSEQVTAEDDPAEDTPNDEN